MERQAYRFAWRGITIEATYTPRQWRSAADLELRSVAPDRAPLPVNETGYRSHFHPVGTIEAHGGEVVAQVIAWLDAEACKPAWRDREAAGDAESPPTAYSPHRVGAPPIRAGSAAHIVV